MSDHLETHWHDAESGETVTAVAKFCPQCMARAVMPLPKRLLAAQPDDTSHVCLPALGGCNQGYGIPGSRKARAKPRKRAVRGAL